MSASPKTAPTDAQSFLEAQFSGEKCANVRPPFHATLRRLGLLDRDDVLRVIESQSRTGATFGKTARALGLLSASELQYALGVQLKFVNENHAQKAIPESLFIAKNPFSREADKFRSIANKLLTINDDGGQRSFCVTSAHASCDAEFSALNLAAAMAISGERVLIIDTLSSGSDISRRLGIQDGLSLDIEISEQTVLSACQTTIINGLYCLSITERQIDRFGFITVNEFRSLHQIAMASFDRVIVVAKPQTSRPLCDIYWSVTACVMLVVKKHLSRAKTLYHLRNEIRAANADVIGSIIID